jgi:tRNA1(Val) A37 N6-methylase TrmN6
MPDSAAPPLTEDTLLGGGVRLFQPRRGYRAGVDAVLLAAAVPDKAGPRVLELGCGVGAATLCLARREPDWTVTGLEVQPEMAGLARRNVEANDCGDRVAILDGDLLRPPAGLKAGGFDGVMMNPPYQEADHGPLPPHAGRATAHVEGEAVLADWIGTGLRLLKTRGRLVLIHRADRMAEIMTALEGRAGGIEVLPLWPGGGKPAKRVIVRARKGGRAPLTLLPGLVLHQADGSYTPEAEAIFREGAAIP